METNVISYNDIMAFHPGYYVADIIEDMEITQVEFATRMGTTPKTLSKLINGQINLSNDLAKKLSVMLGTSVELWLNLQKTFNEKLIEIEKQKDLDSQIEVVSLIDYSFFERVAGFSHTRDKAEKVASLCKYFKIADLKILKQPDFLVNFRTGISNASEKNVINAQAWVQTALNFADDVEVSDFDAEKLRSYLEEIRGMTVKEPTEFMPRLREIFSSCGVVFVMLPTLKNSGINGAVKWINPNRVVLAMNDRRHYADTFWFSLFHEIKHVLQQKIKTVFISTDDKERANQRLENEADEFSQNYLIPKSALEIFIREKGVFVSENDIKSFAEKIGIHPGIVVGRLQHEKIIPQHKFVDLKKKYELVKVN